MIGDIFYTYLNSAASSNDNLLSFIITAGPIITGIITGIAGIYLGYKLNLNAKAIEEERKEIYRKLDELLLPPHNVQR